MTIKNKNEIGRALRAPSSANKFNWGSGSRREMLSEEALECPHDKSLVVGPGSYLMESSSGGVADNGVLGGGEEFGGSRFGGNWWGGWSVGSGDIGGDKGIFSGPGLRVDIRVEPNIEEASNCVLGVFL